MKLSPEDLRVALLCIPADKAHGLRADIASHIAALEAERDAALADNAALASAIETAADGECDFCGAFAPNHAEYCMFGRVLSQPHPGAALLEEHRSDMVRARNEGLEKAAKWAEALSVSGLTYSSETIAVCIRAMKEPTPCCERDADGDGNCDRHPGHRP